MIIDSTNMNDDTAGDSASERDADDTAAALETIYTLAGGAGYVRTKETVKLAELASPEGDLLYLEKTRLTLNNIRFCVHPSRSRESLLRMAGVETVSSEHRFHSNMTAFPKRLHRGKTKTAYGWQVKIDTLLGLDRFLADFAGTKHDRA